jgi:O-antigen ligase
MRNYSSVLVVVGSLCLLITLGLAWCLVGVRSSAFMKKLFPSYQNLLKAHIDYLLMTGLLMIFFLLFTHFRESPSLLVVFAMSVGSFMNPVGFIALAMRPDLRQQPTSPFGAVMAGSFTLTTIGYAGAAWSIGQAALRAL